MEQIENKTNNIAENISNQMNKITSISFKDFLSSNTFISKVAFTLLVMFVFFLLIKFSITFIPKIFKENNSPYIFKGTIEGSHPVIIRQDPKYKNSIPIHRSVNEKDGIEFSWSVWLFINDETFSDNKLSQNIHIFHKGDVHTNNNLFHKIAAPGLYLNNKNNTLIVTMNTHNNTETLEEVSIDNVPINKWVNVIIRVKNKRLDVYINGTIKRSFQLQNIPQQNYGEIYISQKSQNNSFQGSKLSNLRYHDHALNVYEIQKIFYSGPNRTLITKNAMTDTNYSYLAFDWYY